MKLENMNDYSIILRHSVEWSNANNIRLRQSIKSNSLYFSDGKTEVRISDHEPILRERFRSESNTTPDVRYWDFESWEKFQEYLQSKLQTPKFVEITSKKFIDSKLQFLTLKVDKRFLENSLKIYKKRGWDIEQIIEV